MLTDCFFIAIPLYHILHIIHTDLLGIKLFISYKTREGTP